MCLFKYVFSVEHDSVDARHLLKYHQHDANNQRLVDAGVFEVGYVEGGTLREIRQTIHIHSMTFPCPRPSDLTD